MALPCVSVAIKIKVELAPKIIYWFIATRAKPHKVFCISTGMARRRHQCGYRDSAWLYDEETNTTCMARVNSTVRQIHLAIPEEKTTEKEKERGYEKYNIK